MIYVNIEETLTTKSKLFLLKTKEQLAYLIQLIDDNKIPNFKQPQLIGIWYDDEFTYGQNDIVRFEEMGTNENS